MSPTPAAAPDRSPPAGLRALAAATPASRDRYLDFLRVASILVVMVGHWLMAVVSTRHGQVSATNALAELPPGLRLATWLLQVMPVFFFVGGFSNLVAIEGNARRGGTYARFLAARAARLMRPTVVFVAVWLAVTLLCDLAGLATGVLGPATGVLARPLWFLGLYLLVVALAPAMLRLHRRFGVGVVAVLGLGAALVDLARLGLGMTGVGYLNFALVWLFAHQLGFFYADGTLTGHGRRAAWAMAGLGLAALAVLTGPGGYPLSMVGLPGDGASNMDPPSLCLVALTVWLTGLVALGRGPLSRWLARERVWTVVVAASSVAMTMFLWHLTALLLGVVLLYPLGFPQPAVGTAAWWLLRPAWLAALGALLTPLVLLFGRFERPRGGRRAASAPAGPASVAALALLVVGTLGFAVGGFHPLTGTGATLVVLPVSPGLSLVCLAAGLFLLRPPRERSRVRRAGRARGGGASVAPVRVGVHDHHDDA